MTARAAYENIVNMKMLRFVILLACLCASALLQGQVPATPETSDATVYFYRLRDGYAAVLKPSIFADKHQLLRMRNGRFAVVKMSPGSHEITSTFPGNGLIINMKPGETYYVRLNMTMATFAHTSRGQVTQVAESQGKFEVSQLKPSEDEDTKPDGEVQK